MAGEWQYYRFDWQLTSSTAQSVFNNANSTDSYDVPPSKSYKWNSGAWKERGNADAPIDCSDADTIYLAWDSTTRIGYSSNSNSIDINIASAAVPEATTGTLGGAFSGNSSGNYYYSQTVIVSGIIGETGITPSPPVVKLRADNNGSSSGYITAFLSFRRDAC